MKRFAHLLDRLSLQAQRNGKIRLLTDYFQSVPDPDRGWALAALTGGLDFPTAKPALLKGLTMDRVDPTLFELSYDYVGDLAETISLIWPAPPTENSETDDPHGPSLDTVVTQLQQTTKAAMPALLARWFDTLDASGRWALVKLMTGGLRVGVSARLAKTAVAKLGDADVSEIEEIWYTLKPPYTDLFAWMEGSAPRPEATVHAPFRPVMLAHPLEDTDHGTVEADAYRAEWKWDGIRIQAVSEAGTKRLYSRTGEDISGTFPDVIEAMTFEGAIDGELLVMHGDQVAPFADLQKRLNRKTVSIKLLDSHPAAIMAYDLLVLEGEDLRPLPFETRRARLKAWHGETTPGRIHISPSVPYNDLDHLNRLRSDPPFAAIEGVMLKRADSAYLAGRIKGPWFKWKRDPHLVDAVLMYAQRGHGKRSSYYSDYTFGVWREGPEGEELVPVGKAYFGFTDEELAQIDKFVRNNTTNRFGPVREVVHGTEEGLVLEVAFEGLQRSTRHKSGIAMRFPRISRLRWDKPPREADRIGVLTKLLPEEII